MIKIQDILKIFANLSKREKTILYVAASVISVLVIDRLIVAPFFGKLKSLDTDIVEKQASIKKDLHILAQKDKIQAESAKYDTVYKSVISEEAEMTLFLKDLEVLASKTSVYLVDMKPSGVKATGGSKKFIVTMNCEAQMGQFADFVYNVENANKLLMVEKYQVSPKSKDSSVAKISVTVSKVVLP